MNAKEDSGKEESDSLTIEELEDASSEEEEDERDDVARHAASRVT